MLVRVKSAVRTLLVKAMRKTMGLPHVRLCALYVLAKCPPLKKRLRLVAMRAHLIEDWSNTTPTDRLPLSRRAERIYADLQRTLRQERK